MNALVLQFKKVTPLCLIVFALGCFVLRAQAIEPAAPATALPGGNTADGDSALAGLTTGSFNSAFGGIALFSNGAGNFNTGVGYAALLLNTANENTATGAGALFSATSGGDNTADGAFALFSNTTGFDNTAIGFEALAANTIGCGHVAIGLNSLVAATSGCSVFAANTAVGTDALAFNTTGTGNTGIGFAALLSNTTGALNTAIGNGAGAALTTGDNNIDIGNAGAAGESNTIRIGVQGTQTFTIIAGISNDIQAFGTPVIVTTDGFLGVAASSARFKDEIRQMDNASEALFALKPVTFHYKKEIDPAGIPQFGLVAEDVEKVNAALVVRDKEGKPYSVRYDQVNAMLLNEFLKEHKKVETLESTVATLAATVKEQALEIQKVSAQIELTKAAPQTVLNNH